MKRFSSREGYKLFDDALPVRMSTAVPFITLQVAALTMSLLHNIVSAAVARHEHTRSIN